MSFDHIPWTLGTAKQEGRPLLVRFREIPDTFAKHVYPYRLNVFWQMVSITSAGLPDDEESERLKTFEDRLVEAVEPDTFAILTAVLTRGGEREFVFHARDRTDFVNRLTRMPQEHERYPIDIQAYEDTAWAYDEAITAPYQPK